MSAGDVFMDSGAWSLYTRKVLKKGKGAARMGRHGRQLEEQPLPPEQVDYSFFDLTKGSEFRKYCDQYAAFMKNPAAFMEKNGVTVGPAVNKVRLFANLDVIGSPDGTWQTQKYFENEHGLKPVPIIHRGTHMKYLDRYLALDYKMIGLGGFASGVGGWREMREYCDAAFLRICPESNEYLPIIRVHGFAMTGWRGIRRWPWFSVDSTSWVIWPSNGWIPVPRWSEKTGWRYDLPPIVMNVCPGSKTKQLRQRHFDNVPLSGQTNLKRWLDEVGVSWGLVAEGGKVNPGGIGLGPTDDGKGEMVEYGVTSHHRARTMANLHYFIGLEKSLPEWPWPLDPSIIHSNRRYYEKGFGL